MANPAPFRRYGDVIASHGLQLHQYADDCQVCLATLVDDAALAVDQMCCRRRCLDEFKPATSQLVQVAGDVAGTQEPDRQDQHQECPSALVDRQHR